VEESLRSALAKIGVDSPLSSALRESVADQQVLDPRVGPGGTEAGEALSALAEALAALRPVRFPYYSLSSDEIRLRTVEPYGIGYFRGSWYLVGRDAEKDDVRVFRTSRIRGEVVALGEGAYEVPADFDLRARVGVAPWELREGARVRARIRFEPEVAWMIRGNLRAGQEFQEAEDGGGVLVLTATDVEALVRWIAEYGPLAEVLRPPKLRKRMVDHYRRLLARGAK
jgi:predicted DNA-binding transcriptional regulator YafY